MNMIISKFIYFNNKYTLFKYIATFFLFHYKILY